MKNQQKPHYSLYGAQEVTLATSGGAQVTITTLERFHRWQVTEDGKTYVIMSQPTYNALWARLQRAGYHVASVVQQDGTRVEVRA